MAGRHLPPDHGAGDADTIGGYMAVHARPAAFEGRDGMSYSVSLETDETGDPVAPFGAYFLFLRWKRLGPQGIDGHLESEFLESAHEARDARDALGRWRLSEVQRILDALIRDAAGHEPSRRWWDVMRDES